MIDITALREQPELKRLLALKDPAFPIDRMLELDEQVRHMRKDLEELRHEKNKLAKSHGPISQEEKARSRQMSEMIAEKERLLAHATSDFEALYLVCPNIPLPDVPAGNKESNKVVSTWGKQPSFDFKPRNHVELNEKVRWFDFEAAARMTASNFVFYHEQGARLIYILAHFMLNNNKKHGFATVLPPYLVNERALLGVGQFPIFKGAVYEIPEDKLYTTPTSEANLTALHQDHTFVEAELPVRHSAWTSCFRREAGTYGSTERGLIRIHQFEKVELYTVTTPLEAFKEQARMLAAAEDILQQLGLHYRVSLLAAQDCSFASAKTYDIEVWMPGQGAYYEVSSASYCTDFQARRSGIRYKAADGGKSRFAHTLNASSLALPRLMVALMETYQQADGSLLLPDVLKSVTISL